MTTIQPYVKLANGLKMPLLGLGTWKSDDGKVKASVKHAITVGYRHIDAAWVYDNQGEVGDAIAEAIAEKKVKREDLWVTSKLWNRFHRKEDVETHLRETLSQLKLDYLDLYLIHWPVTGEEGDKLNPSTEETWKAMEEVLAKGLVKTIGVSNFSVKKLQEMKAYAKVFPAVNQVEAHPIWRQDELIQVSNKLGVHTTAYSPLGSPDSAADIAHAGESLLKHPLVNEIASRVHKSPAQVLIKWALQRGTSVIPKSVTPSRIEDNFNVFSWDLSSDDFNKLNALTPQSRFLHGSFFLNPAGPYKTLNDLWDE